jgi:hypothetical protein
MLRRIANVKLALKDNSALLKEQISACHIQAARVGAAFPLEVRVLLSVTLFAQRIVPQGNIHTLTVILFATHGPHAGLVLE